MLKQLPFVTAAPDPSHGAVQVGTGSLDSGPQHPGHSAPGGSARNLRSMRCRLAGGSGSAMCGAPRRLAAGVRAA